MKFYSVRTKVELILQGFFDHNLEVEKEKMLSFNKHLKCMSLLTEFESVSDGYE